nr:hypothetical protein [Roseibium aggregatum]
MKQWFGAQSVDIGITIEIEGNAPVDGEAGCLEMVRDHGGERNR